MSTYYTFYVGKRNGKGRYSFIGPYIKDENGSLTLTPFFWRSRSFIQWDSFNATPIEIEDMDAEVLNECSYESLFNDDKRVSCGYWISQKDLSKMGSSDPVRGYVPVEQAKELVSSNYDLEYIEYAMDRPISADVVAGMSDEERSKYCYVSYVNYYTPEYQADFIASALDEYYTYNSINESLGEELGVIVSVG